MHRYAKPFHRCRSVAAASLALLMGLALIPATTRAEETTDTEAAKEPVIGAADGTVIQLTERPFRRSKDFFRKIRWGDKLLQYYKTTPISSQRRPRALLTTEERRAMTQLELDPMEQIDYDVKTKSATVYVPDGFDPESRKREYGILVYLPTEAKPTFPRAWAELMKEKKMIWAAPHDAGTGVPDIVRMALVRDVVATLQEHYKLDEKRTVLMGEDEAAQVALLTAFNFSDDMRGGGVIAVNQTLIVGWRHVAGHVEKTTDKKDRMGRATTESIPVYHELNAPYMEQEDLDRLKKRKVRIAFACTGGEGTKRIIQHWQDWGNFVGASRRAFWVPGKLGPEQLGVMIDYVLNDKTDRKAMRPPEGTFPKVTSEMKYPED